MTDCDVRLGTSVQNLGDMPAALDGRSFIVARFVRALNLRYVRD